MSVAVARRPVEQFQTQVPMPDWQLTPEEEMYGDEAVDTNDIGPMMVDENGMPISAPPLDQGYPQQQPMIQPDGTGAPTQQELDQAFPPGQQQPPQIRRVPPPPQPRQPGIPPQQPQPRSPPPPDPTQPRPYST
jgi:penicillin-binding protein 1A